MRLGEMGPNRVGSQFCVPSAEAISVQLSANVRM